MAEHVGALLDTPRLPQDYEWRTAGFASSPVLVTPEAAFLAQVASGEATTPLLLDMVGSIPVREEPWTPGAVEAD